MQMGMVCAHFVWHWQHHIPKHVQKGWHTNSKPNQFFNCIPYSCDFFKKFIKLCSWCKVWCALPLLNGFDRIYVSLLSHWLQSYHKTELIMSVGWFSHQQTCVKLSLFLVCFHILSNHKILHTHRILTFNFGVIWSCSICVSKALFFTSDFRK